jgi:alpha-glucosidase
MASTAVKNSTHPLAWWQRGVIYQLWVRSYCDSDGDGNGNLPGLISKLDYLAWLGVDVLWLSPVYPSPMIEAGYDVSDYTNVSHLFGRLEDFDRLLDEAHRRNLKVILDFVPNHTSDAHPWFVESRASRGNAKRDWYLWHDPKPDGSPPNNWVGCFGGSAWTFDKETGQFYYHAFLAQQPDVNWRNVHLREAIFDAMRFWLTRGLDGFRMDAIWHLIKDEKLRDNPPNPDYTPDLPPDNVVLNEYTRNLPEVHPFIASMRQVVDEFDDHLLSGELYLQVDKMMKYYGTRARPELHLPFNLQLSTLNWNAREIAGYVEQYEAALPSGAWPNWAVSTHDAKRIATRAGADQAAVAAMLLLTLRGTPTIYYGDEIGMQSDELPREAIEDPRELLTPYLGLGRDPSRTPMQWNSDPKGGFTNGEPWLPLAENFERVNVGTQREDPRSLLTLHRRLIQLRRKLGALVNGNYRTIRKSDSLFVYERAHTGQRVIVALNFSDEPQRFQFEEERGAVVLSTLLDRDDGTARAGVELRANEGAILAIAE